MGIITKIFGKRKDLEETKDPLFTILPIEELRYKIADKFDAAEPGTEITLEYIFGENATDEEYLEFMKIPYRFTGTLPKSDDDFQNALHRIQDGSAEDFDYLKVGYAYLIGNYLARDLKKALDMFTKAADLGDSEAMTMIGGMYLHGDGVEQNDETAVEWYKKAICADGHAEALHDLSQCYDKAKGVPRDPALAFYFMERSAKQGYGPAQSDLAYFYRIGTGVKADMKKALYWYERSAMNNYDSAARFLLNYCIDNNDHEGALKWADRLEKHNDSQGMYNAAVAFRDGETFDKNPQRAFELFEKGAEQGFPQSMYEYSIYLLKGDVVPQDIDKGWVYLNRAAKARYPLAQYVLAKMIWDRDQNKAKWLMSEAAAQGYQPAADFLSAHE